MYILYEILVGKLSSTESGSSGMDVAIQTDADLAQFGMDLRERKGTRGNIPCFTPDLVSTFDRCKMSNESAVRVMIEAAKAFGLDPKQYIINRTSIRQVRTANRQQIVEFLKSKSEVIIISRFEIL